MERLKIELRRERLFSRHSGFLKPRGKPAISKSTDLEGEWAMDYVLCMEQSGWVVLPHLHTCTMTQF